jgi:uncharacterized protein YmfQ (DUF2313 family)
MNAAGYARMMRQLLPPGWIWKEGDDSLLAKFFLGAADELERIDLRGQALSWESDPRTATEMLPEFEADLGLVADGTLAERRARVVARLIARQRVRPVDFQLALAPLLGQAAIDVVVMERTAAWAASVGDQREIYRFFIYRDPTEPGAADIDAAQALVDDMAHSHTKGHVIESINFLCDDEFSLCDRDLLGA